MCQALALDDTTPSTSPTVDKALPHPRVKSSPGTFMSTHFISSPPMKQSPYTASSSAPVTNSETREARRLAQHRTARKGARVETDRMVAFFHCVLSQPCPQTVSGFLQTQECHPARLRKQERGSGSWNLPSRCTQGRVRRCSAAMTERIFLLGHSLCQWPWPLIAGMRAVSSSSTYVPPVSPPREQWEPKRAQQKRGGEIS